MQGIMASWALSSCHSGSLSVFFLVIKSCLQKDLGKRCWLQKRKPPELRLGSCMDSQRTDGPGTTPSPKRAGKQRKPALPARQQTG